MYTHKKKIRISDYIFPITDRENWQQGLTLSVWKFPTYDEGFSLNRTSKIIFVSLSEQ
jgi:hypothetical protein